MEASRHNRQPQRPGFQRSFGEALRHRRVLKGFTQEGLALVCGLSRQTISVLEHGHTSPRRATLAVLAAALADGKEGGFTPWRPVVNPEVAVPEAPVPQAAVPKAAVPKAAVADASPGSSRTEEARAAL